MIQNMVIMTILMIMIMISTIMHNNDSYDKIDDNAAISTIMKINTINNDRFSTNFEFIFAFDNRGVTL